MWMEVGLLLLYGSKFCRMLCLPSSVTYVDTSESCIFWADSLEQYWKAEGNNSRHHRKSAVHICFCYMYIFHKSQSSVTQEILTSEGWWVAWQTSPQGATRSIQWSKIPIGPPGAALLLFMQRWGSFGVSRSMERECLSLVSVYPRFFGTCFSSTGPLLYFIRDIFILFTEFPVLVVVV